MPGRYLYEYAVIRIVPNVEREEFVNVGVILFSKPARFIKMRYFIQEEKLKIFAPDADIDLFRQYLDAFTLICSGSAEGGALATLEIPERFRWLVAVRSACVQTSRPHAGLSADLDRTFEKLYDDLVL